MNPVQEAILGVLGVRDELEARETAWEAEKTEILDHLESTDNQNALLIRQIEDLDYLNLYDIQNITEIIPAAKRLDTINRLRRLRHENPMAKQGVQLIKRFTLGRGVQWTTEHDGIRDAINEIWRDPENEKIFTTHKAQKELLDDIVTDGEKFTAAFGRQAVAPFVRFAEIPLEEIKQIIYDPNNRKVPVWYKRVFIEQKFNGKTEQYTPEDTTPKTLYYLDHSISDERLKEIKGINIPEGKKAKDENKDLVRIFHDYALGIRGKSGVRGVSELYSSREWFRVFRDFMQNRAAINEAATAVAWRRKIKGGPTEVARFKGKLGDLDVGYDASNPARSLTRPIAGGTYDSNPAVDLEWMKTDTGATQAKEDARMLLMAAGIGMATSIHYLGEGGDANLATAQAMELPMVKAYEDWQTFFKESVLHEKIKYALGVAFPDGVSLDKASTEADEPSNHLPGVQATDFDPKHPEDLVAWVFPPIITQDVVKATSAIATLVTQIARDNVTIGIAALRQALTVLGIPNIDQILKSAEVEQRALGLERKAAADAARQNLINGTGAQPPIDPKKNGKNGKNPPDTGFVKAGSTGLDAGTQRLANGKPPIDHKK